MEITYVYMHHQGFDFYLRTPLPEIISTGRIEQSFR